jgi:hypothetical protein
LYQRLKLPSIIGSGLVTVAMLSREIPSPGGRRRATRDACRGRLPNQFHLLVAPSKMPKLKKRKSRSKTMALQFVYQPGNWNRDLETVRFHALDGQMPVMCSVSKAALLDAERMDTATPEELVNLFAKHRIVFEAAAQRNYDAGLRHGYFGDVLVTTLDVGGGYALS